MESWRKRVATAQECDGTDFRTRPEIIELRSQGSSRAQAGALALFASLGASSAILSARNALLSGSAPLAAVVRSINPRQRRSHLGTTLLTLRYCDKPIVSLSLDEHNPGCVLIPFPGGALSLDQFVIESRSRADKPVLRLLVVVQPPALSPLEQELTRRVPDDVPDGLSPFSIFRSHDFLFTAEGWAVGGYIPQVIALRMRQKGRPHSQSQCSTGTGISNSKGNEKTFDLSLPALDLLETYATQQLR